MTAIVRIASYDFMFPDEMTAAKVIGLLGKAMQICDHSYKGVIEIDPEYPADIEMRILTRPVKFQTRDGKDAAAPSKRVIRRGKELKGPKQLLLAPQGEHRPI